MKLFEAFTLPLTQATIATTLKMLYKCFVPYFKVKIFSPDFIETIVDNATKLYHTLNYWKDRKIVNKIVDYLKIRDQRECGYSRGINDCTNECSNITDERLPTNEPSMDKKYGQHLKQRGDGFYLIWAVQDQALKFIASLELNPINLFF